MKIIVTPRLGELLKSRGLTQVQFSKMTKINQGTISSFDRSMQHRDNHLFTIARALDVSIEELFKVVEEYDED